MYYIHSYDNGYPLFYVDTESDVDDLPTFEHEGNKATAYRERDYRICPIGSHAFVSDNQTVKTLNTENEWV